ncbi:hypothetical protein Tco_0799125 [Tanacetum coccineum]
MTDHTFPMKTKAVRIAKSIFVPIFMIYLGSSGIVEGLRRGMGRRNSWFCTLLMPYNDFVSDERVFGWNMEGLSQSCLVSRNRSAKIGNKWGEALDIEDNFGSSFARKRLCILTKQPVIYIGEIQGVCLYLDDECNVDGVSETIFSDNVDECNVDGHGVRDASTSLSHPPGFTPKTSVTHANVGEICEDGPTNGERMVICPRGGC